MSVSYTNKDNVEAYLNTTITGSIDSYIEAVQEWIDGYLNRSFQSELAETKYYDGDGTKTIYIDDFTAISEVMLLDSDGDNDEIITEDKDFYTYPYNSDIKNKLILMPSGSRGAFPRGTKRVKITANFGSATIPKDIELASTMLTADIYNRTQTGGKNVQSESLGDYSVSYKDIEESFNSLQAKNLLDKHRIFEI